MSHRRSASVFAVLVLFLAGLLGSCGSESGPGSNPGTTECLTPDTGGNDAERAAADTTLVGKRDPSQGSGSLGAGGQPGADTDDEQSNSGDGGMSSPGSLDPDDGEGTGGNADTGSGGSSRSSC